MGRILAMPGGAWVIVAALAILAASLAWLGCRAKPAVLKWALLGVAVIVGALVAAMAFGAGTLAVRMSQLESERPAAGQLVDVGGYRAYVLCEGPRNRDTIVWLAGGYSLGRMMKPLHDGVKADRRSCLIDRPGTGWADDAPLPRDIDTILEEIRLALAGAGETSPYILAGHSMGGLYSVNYAEAYPDEVKALILLDPTPALWFVEMAERLGCGSEYREDFNLWGATFGMGLVQGLNPRLGPASDKFRAVFGTDWETMALQESSPRTLAAEWSAGNFACSHPVSLVRTPGALRDLPLLKIVQARKYDLMANAPADLSPRVQRNWARMQNAWDGEHILLTTRGELAYAPEGFDHMFPILESEWTLGRIRPFLEGLDAPPGAGGPP